MQGRTDGRRVGVIFRSGRHPANEGDGVRQRSRTCRLSDAAPWRLVAPRRAAMALAPPSVAAGTSLPPLPARPSCRRTRRALLRQTVPNRGACGVGHRAWSVAQCERRADDGAGAGGARASPPPPPPSDGGADVPGLRPASAHRRVPQRLPPRALPTGRGRVWVVWNGRAPAPRPWPSGRGGPP